MNVSTAQTIFLRVAATVCTVALVLVSTGCLNDPPKQSGVFLTQDSGTSWQSVPDLTATGFKSPKIYPPLTTTAVAVSPKNAKQVVAGTDNDLYQSGDGGSTWEKLTSKLPANIKAIVVHQVAFHPTQANTYFTVGVSGGYGKVLRTTDNGKTFQDMFTVSKPGQAVTSIVIRPDNGMIFIGDQLGSIFRSSDNGQTWQRVFSIQQMPISSLTVSGPALFVGTVGQGVWRSGDDGGSFAPAGTNVPQNAQNVWSMVSGLGGVYAGTEKGLFLSRDSGATWQSVGNPLPQGIGRVQALAVSGSSLYFATNAVVYKMNPTGTSFSSVQLKLARNVFSLAASASAPNTLYGGATAGGGDYTKRYATGLSGFNVIPGGN